MKLLAIDTSATACSVALSVDGKITQFHQIAPAQQAQLVLPMIDELLKSNHLTIKELDALAFGCGPGSFTGVRIATSVIQGLGYATELPIIPISSLAALAQATYDDLQWKNIAVAVDARMQEIYWATYQVNVQGLVELLGQEILSPPENIVLSNEINWYGAGNGWEVYQEKLFFNPVVIDATRLPTAQAILKLAIPKCNNQEWVDVKEIAPVYLREKVAS